MLQASHGPYYTFFSIHLAEIGYGKFSIGTLWALGVLAEVGLFLVMHKVLARFPMRTIMLCAATLTAFRWLVIAEFSAILWILLGPSFSMRPPTPHCTPLPSTTSTPISVKGTRARGRPFTAASPTEPGCHGRGPGRAYGGVGEHCACFPDGGDRHADRDVRGLDLDAPRSGTCLCRKQGGLAGRRFLLPHHIHQLARSTPGLAPA